MTVSPLPHQARSIAAMAVAYTVSGEKKTGPPKAAKATKADCAESDRVVSSVDMFKVLQTEMGRIIKVIEGVEELHNADKLWPHEKPFGEDIESLRQYLPEAKKKAASTRYRVAVIGPMKAGKSTAVNSMVGISVAPKRMEAMTQIATVVTNVEGKTIPAMKVFTRPFYGAVRMLHEIAVGNFEYFSDVNPVIVNTEAVQSVVYKMSKDVKDVFNQIRDNEENWIEQLSAVAQNSSDEGQMLITGESVASAEELIRSWLTRINDICRIGSFFSYADGFDKIEAPVGVRLRGGLLFFVEQMFEDANLPEIEVEMELCRRFPGGTVGSFSLIDTPGPDEAEQGKLLYEKVEQVLQEADAVICVINGRQLRNQAEASVRRLINKMKQFEMQDNILVLINHMDLIPKDQYGLDREEQMRISTADSFLGNSQNLDRVYPTSAFQALCNMQMGKLLEALGEQFPDIEHHTGYESTGYQELLRHLQRDVPHTASWMEEWIQQSYGNDGLPWDLADEDMMPRNLLKAVTVKNADRWTKSRLEKPMEIVFNQWAGKVACANLMEALRYLDCLFGIRDKLQRTYNTSVSGEDGLQMMLEECMNRRNQLISDYEQKVRKQKQEGAKLKRDVQRICRDAQRQLEASIKNEFETNASVFIQKLANERPDWVVSGFFDENGTLCPPEGGTDGYDEDVRVKFGTEMEYNRRKASFMADFGNQVDVFLSRHAKIFSDRLKEFDKDSTDTIADQLKDQGFGKKSISGRNLRASVNDVRTVAAKRKKLFSGRWGFGTAVGGGAAAAAAGAAGFMLASVATGGLAAVFAGAAAVAGGVGAGFAKTVATEKIALSRNLMDKESHISGTIATKQWSEQVLLHCDSEVDRTLGALEDQHERNSIENQDEIHEIVRKRDQAAGAKEQEARKAMTLMSAVDYFIRELKVVKQHCEFVQEQTGVNFGDVDGPVLPKIVSLVPCPIGRSHHHIFLSYRRVDHGLARAIVMKLEALGYKVFMDVGESGLKAGNFQEQLEDRLKNTPVVLALFTQHTNADGSIEFNRIHKKGDFVRLELRAALGLKKLLIPFFASDFDLRGLVSSADLPPDVAAVRDQNMVKLDAVTFFDESIARVHSFISDAARTGKLDELTEFDGPLPPELESNTPRTELNSATVLDLPTPPTPTPASNLPPGSPAAAAGTEVDFATLPGNVYIQLKSQLKTRNLLVDGTNEEMVARLEAYERGEYEPALEAESRSSFQMPVSELKDLVGLHETAISASAPTAANLSAVDFLQRTAQHAPIVLVQATALEEPAPELVPEQVAPEQAGPGDAKEEALVAKLKENKLEEFLENFKVRSSNCSIYCERERRKFLDCCPRLFV
jgi:GTPase SAR1 family protein